eukprot:TRINITY_DN879_c0_g4_i1.p1 TRINITY_DN879_c0_g4~~TRINITY_DN879_c0_g4_i1.p1  ORF type:complete len:635 (+),score=215.22 TRINITY_DN879_c0_g4_i1:122-2026(+)
MATAEGDDDIKEKRRQKWLNSQTAGGVVSVVAEQVALRKQIQENLKNIGGGLPSLGESGGSSGSSAPAAADASPSAAAKKDTSEEDKKSAENLARLPPKLRARLMARGILKDPEAKPKAAPGTPPEPSLPCPGTPPEPGPPCPGTPPDPSCPGTPPEPESIGQQAAAAAKAAALAKAQAAAAALSGSLVAASGALTTASLASPALSKASAVMAMASGTIAKQPPPAGAVGKAAAMPPPGAVGKAAAMVAPGTMGKAAAAAGLMAPPPLAAQAVPQVYSSAPVINTAALQKRKGDDEEDADDEAKRQRLQGLSPADLRAAEARAAGGEVTSWVISPEVANAFAQASAQAQHAAQVAAAQAAAAASVPANTPEAAIAAAEAAEALGAGAPAAADTGPPLPAGWVRVPHDGEFYFWNTTTNEVSWEHPGQAKKDEKKQEKEKKPHFQEEHKILWSDIGKIIGRNGINLKIIKASIGCTIKIPRKGGEKGGKGDGKGGKGKGKDKGKKDKGDVIRGRGDGSVTFGDDDFAKVIITGDTATAARGGKRTLEVMLGYGRNVERALSELGVEVKQPKLEELEPKLSGPGKKEEKDGADPMDPAAYSDAPMGGWSAGIKKAQGRSAGPNLNLDSKQANAERC